MILYFIYTKNIWGDNVPLYDSETGEPNVYRSYEKARDEVKLLNRDTAGGYHLKRFRPEDDENND